MARLLETLRAKYDHVIIDTPPVIELADAGILGGISDEVMLIARISRTPKPLVDQALRALRSYNAPVAGVIAVDARGVALLYRGARASARRSALVRSAWVVAPLRTDDLSVSGADR